MEGILSNWDQLTARVKSLEEDIARLENRQHGPPHPFSDMLPTLEGFPGIPQADWSAPPNSVHAEETRSTVDPSEILQSFQNCYTEGGPANVQVHGGGVPDSVLFTSLSLFTQAPLLSDIFGEPPTSPPTLQDQPPPEPEEVASSHENLDSEFPAFNPWHNLSQAQFPPGVSSRGNGDTASPPICDICGRIFGRKADVHRHRMSIHVRPEPIYCPVPGCPRSSVRGFARKDKLVCHFRKAHPTLPQTQYLLS
ncbi:MAG: hypothetical protein M1839_007901 [Geoglossum umbratile]|nr:MAG: hypothetical protein M1839_007901 [Geoglossum umbratile]